MASQPDSPSDALPRLMATLSDLGAQDETVRLGDVIDAVGDRSHAILLLVPAMLLVSPLSGIFGLSTLTGLLMTLIIVQALLRRDRMWLPKAVANRRMPARRFKQTVEWLRRPVRWIDRHTHQRLQILVSPPLRLASWLLSLGICLLIPFLELLPFTTSIAAFAIALMCLGMVLRDGLFVLAGYAMIGAFTGLLAYLLR